MADTSQRERITQYIQGTYGTQAEYLWADSPGNAIFRHSASKKWYAALMCVLPEKLGLTGEEALDVMDIKCSTKQSTGQYAYIFHNSDTFRTKEKARKSLRAVTILIF